MNQDCTTSTGPILVKTSAVVPGPVDPPTPAPVYDYVDVLGPCPLCDAPGSCNCLNDLDCGDHERDLAGCGEDEE